jgi:hypothetical protein
MEVRFSAFRAGYAYPSGKIFWYLILLENGPTPRTILLLDELEKIKNANAL